MNEVILTCIERKLRREKDLWELWVEIITISLDHSQPHQDLYDVQVEGFHCHLLQFCQSRCHTCCQIRVTPTSNHGAPDIIKITGYKEPTVYDAVKRFWISGELKQKHNSARSGKRHIPCFIAGLTCWTNINPPIVMTVFAKKSHMLPPSRAPRILAWYPMATERS